eukprot:2738589-Amphidinium_carterae.2
MGRHLLFNFPEFWCIPKLLELFVVLVFCMVLVVGSAFSDVMVASCELQDGISVENMMESRNILEYISEQYC